jgi:hypothetical protein
LTKEIHGYYLALQALSRDKSTADDAGETLEAWLAKAS